MSALKEFANLISLNMADLAATYARLLEESDTAYEAVAVENRIASGRKLLRATSQACQQQTSEPLSQFFKNNPSPEGQQPTNPLNQLECLGNTLTPVVPNLDAGKFLWKILATVRRQLLTTQFESAVTSSQAGTVQTVDVLPSHSQSQMDRQQLAERVRFLSYLVESSQVAQVALDESGTIQYVNPYFCQLYGYREDEVVKQHISLLSAQANPEQQITHFFATVQEQDVWRGEDRRKRKDGSEFPASVSFTRIFDANGQTVAYLDVSRDITTRHDAETELRQAEEQYRLLVEQIPAAVHISRLDEASSTRYISPQIEAIVGYAPQEWVDNPNLWQEILHPDDREMVQAANSKSLESGEPFSIEYRMVAKNGTIVWVKDEAKLIYNNDGQAVAQQGLIFDITTQKNIDLELRQRQQEQQIILDSVPAIIIFKDTENRILRANQQAAQLMGLSLDELEGQSVYDLNPAEAEAYHQDDLEVINSGQPKLGIVEPLTTETGETRWLRTDKIPYKSDNGELAGVVVFALDITERTRVEQALKSSEDRYRATFEQVPVGIGHVGLDGQWLWVNKTLSEIVGYSQDELVQKTVRDITYREDQAPENPEYRRQLMDGEVNFYGGEKRYVHKNGSLIWIKRTVSLVRDVTGLPQHLIVVIEDISKTKETEEVLQITQFSLDKVGFDVVWAGSNAELMYVNDAACSNLGYSRQELLAMTIYDINPRLTPEMWADHWEELRQRKSFTFDTLHQRKNGDLFPVDISVNYIEFGEQSYNCAIWRDISEQVKAEQQIKESLERRTQQIEISTEIAQEIAGVPVLSDLFKNVVDSIQEKFGYYRVHLYTYEEDSLVIREAVGPVGQKLKADGHKIALAAEQSLVARAARSGEVVLVEDVTQEAGWLPNPLLPNTQSELAIPIKLRDEVLGVLDVQSDVLAGLDQEDQLLLLGLCGQIAVAIDTRRAEDERAKAQAILLETEERMRDLVNDLPVGIFRNTPGADGHFLEANPAIMELFEADSATEFMKYNVSDMYRNPEDRQRFSQKMLEQGHLRGEELALKTLKGREIWGAITAVMKTDVAGQTYFDGMIEDITERKRVQDDLEIALAEAERLAQEQSILAELSQTLTLQESVQSVLKAAYQGASHLLDTSNFSVGLYDAAKEEVTIVYTLNESSADREITTLPVSQGITGYIIRNAKPVLISEDVPAHLAELDIDAIGEAAQSFLGVPIMVGERVLGRISVQSFTTPGIYGAHDLELLQAVATQTALALQQVNQFETIRSTLAETKILQQLAQTLAGALDVEDVANAFFTAAQTLLEVDFVIFSLVDEQQQRVGAIAGINVSENHLRRANHPLSSDDIMADIIRSGQTELFNDVDPRFDPETVAAEGMENWGLRIFTPITIRQQRIGLVEVGFKKQVEIADQEHLIQLLRSLVDQVSVSLDSVRRIEATQINARREQTIREITDKMRRATSLQELVKTTAEELGQRFSAAYTVLDLGIEQTGNGQNEAEQ